MNQNIELTNITIRIKEYSSELLIINITGQIFEQLSLIFSANIQFEPVNFTCSCYYHEFQLWQIIAQMDISNSSKELYLWIEVLSRIDSLPFDNFNEFIKLLDIFNADHEKIKDTTIKIQLFLFFRQIADNFDLPIVSIQCEEQLKGIFDLQVHYCNYWHYFRKNSFEQSFQEYKKYSDSVEQTKELAEINNQPSWRNFKKFQYANFFQLLGAIDNTWNDCKGLFLKSEVLFSKAQTISENSIPLVEESLSLMDKYLASIEIKNSQLIELVNFRKQRTLAFLYRLFKNIERLDKGLYQIQQIQKIKTKPQGLIQNWLIMVESRLVQLDYLICSDQETKTICELTVEIVDLLMESLRKFKKSQSVIKGHILVCPDGVSFNQCVRRAYSEVLKEMFAFSQLLQCDSIKKEWVKPLQNGIIDLSLEKREQWIFQTMMSSICQKLGDMKNCEEMALKGYEVAIQIFDENNEDYEELLDSTLQLQQFYIETNNNIAGVEISMRSDDLLENYQENKNKLREEMKLFKQNCEYLKVTLKAEELGI